jgi:hypothetical protein
MPLLESKYSINVLTSWKKVIKIKMRLLRRLRDVVEVQCGLVIFGLTSTTGAEV